MVEQQHTTMTAWGFPGRFFFVGYILKSHDFSHIRNVRYISVSMLNLQRDYIIPSIPTFARGATPVGISFCLDIGIASG
jgi:hypothetical protein